MKRMRNARCSSTPATALPLGARCRPRAHWRGVAAACVLAAAAGLARPGWAQERAHGEPELKAQIVFRALLFVQWPAQAAADRLLRFCVFDESPLALALRDFDGRRVNDRVFQWRRAAASEAAGCHAAYAGGAPGLAALARTDGPGVFWIGDELGLLERGVMLNLQVEGGRIVFDVGLATLRRAGLDISAKVLRLARYVKES
jgi:hypothetical protein